MASQNQKQLIKFLLSGGIAAAFNIVLMWLLIDQFGWQSPLLCNVANIVAIELSIILSFLLYRFLVWPAYLQSWQRILGIQLPLYHVSTSVAVLLRILILFPALNWIGVHYTINTFVGICIGASINYILSDTVIFRSRSLTRSLDQVYPPEAFAATDKLQPSPRTTKNQIHKISQLDDTALQLSLVIPAYNEADCIASTLDLICTSLDTAKINYDILVVNDNSQDHTVAILKAISQQNKRVSYIDNYYPNGFGFAVRCGLENFAGDAVAIVMADASDPVECIISYYEKLQAGFDCVFGSRFVNGGNVYDYPLHKLVVNRMANAFIQILFGIPFNDTTNAFKAYRREVIDGVSPLISHHFNLTVELPLKSIVRGYSIAVIPVSWYNRTTGISNLKLREMGSRYLFIVLSILLEKWLARGDYLKKDSVQFSDDQWTVNRSSIARH